MRRLPDAVAWALFPLANPAFQNTEILNQRQFEKSTPQSTQKMANQDRQVLLDTIHEMDIELRQAARAGLLLLEKNEDLEAQVDRARFQQREASMEADTLREQRKTAVLEVNAALTRIKELEEQLRHDRAAHQAVQDSFLGKIDALQSELRKAYKKTTQTLREDKRRIQNDEDDPRLALLQLDKTRLKRQLQDALKETSRLDIESTRAATTTNEHIVALERAMLQLTMEKDNGRGADGRKSTHSGFATDQPRKVVDAQAIQDLDQGVVSLHDDIMHTNAMLQLRVNQLQEDAIQEDAKEDDEQHWTMGYPVLRGLLVVRPPTMNAPTMCPRGCIPDVVSNAFPSFASSDDNGSVDFSLSNYEPPKTRRIEWTSFLQWMPNPRRGPRQRLRDGWTAVVCTTPRMHPWLDGWHPLRMARVAAYDVLHAVVDPGETIRRHPNRRSYREDGPPSRAHSNGTRVRNSEESNPSRGL
ncbi:hypothetical protein Ae201684P_010275 [Aphanomyces euteiches]|nr:hypothetical protein Ae201684P_010275 [Aphanomyces euteiches]